MDLYKELHDNYIIRIIHNSLFGNLFVKHKTFLSKKVIWSLQTVIYAQVGLFLDLYHQGIKTFFIVILLCNIVVNYLIFQRLENNDMHDWVYLMYLYYTI